MAWTKEDVIKKAFGEIGLASYAFDLTAAERQDAMEKLDSMMAVWTAENIVFDPVYPQPATIDAGNITDLTNAPDRANGAMFLNLAIRIARGYGKTPSIDTKADANIEYNKLLAAYALTNQVSLVGMIVGAGAKTPLIPFIESEVES